MKFNKKHIKALKEGKVAMTDADKYPELAQKVLDKAFPDDTGNPLKYCIDNNLNIDFIMGENGKFWSRNHKNTYNIPTLSVKDFFNPSIETLTENDVVVCDNEKQYCKIRNLNMKVTIVEAGELVSDYPGSNIIPYRDLFPKKKKGKWKREVKKLKEAGSLLQGEFVNLQDRFYELEKWAISKSERLMRDIEQPQPTAIDWDKPGCYVGESGIIVLSDGAHDSETFAGVVIRGNFMTELGHYEDKWIKKSFKPCNVTIIEL